MCRYVAYVGDEMPARGLVFGGDHSLETQSFAPKELLQGSVNADGYGVAWYHEGRPTRIREVRPIWQDPDLEGVLSYVRSPCMIAVVRNATLGIPVDRAGLAPLMSERWTFALNGFVQGFRRTAMRRLRASLSDELYARIEGTSDTETLFMLAVAELRQDASVGEALARVADRVLSFAREVGLEAHLNMILADGQAMAATRTSISDATNSLYVSSRGPLSQGGVLIASEPLDAEGGWQRVPPHHLVEASAGEDACVSPLS